MAYPTSHVESLTRSFALVPPAAAPAIVSCVLASVPSLSASQLLSSLLDAFPHHLEEVVRKEDSKLDSRHSNSAICYAVSLFHLAKIAAREECGSDVGRQLVWRAIVPLLRVTSPSDKCLLNQIEKMLCDAISTWLSWDIMDETLVPLCLKLICHSSGIKDFEDLTKPYGTLHMTGCFWGDCSNDLDLLPVKIASHVLIFLLDMALRVKAENGTEGGEYLYVNKDGHSASDFACKLACVLSELVIEMLSQTVEHRSIAIRLLLPSTLQAFLSIPCSETAVQGKPPTPLRCHFSTRIWECCRTLFSLGKLERADAYNILSLYTTFFSNDGVYKFPMGGKNDMREKQEFWVEIRRGLVDKDSLIRKSSLYILKLSLGDKDVCQDTEDKILLAKESHSIVLDGYSNVTTINLPDPKMTKRDKWAQKEAKSLGVGELHNFTENSGGKGRWKAFILLYEMLEEYGTHLVEAAWTRQVHLFFQSKSDNLCVQGTRSVTDAQMGTLEGMFLWLAVLWERGLFHDNPLVRCLILDSIISIDWECHENHAKEVPEAFILGPFMQSLNDAVHHKDFGMKGVYTSKSIHGATRFLSVYSRPLCRSARIAFLCRLASVTKQESFGRPGLMALSFCISSVACGYSQCSEGNDQSYSSNLRFTESEEFSEKEFLTQKSLELLEALGVIIQRSKHHFNPKYRLKVCEQALTTVNSVTRVYEVPLDNLLHFLSNLPGEFTDFGGPLRRKVLEWFCYSSNGGNDRTVDSNWVSKNLCSFPEKFIIHHLSSGASFSFDDDDVKSWGLEAQRWALAFFLVVNRMDHFNSIFAFLKNNCSNICKCDSSVNLVPVKYLIIFLKFIEEFRKWSFKSVLHVKKNIEIEVEPMCHFGLLSPEEVPIIIESFRSIILSITEDLVQFATSVCAIFWSCQTVDDATLPSWIKGKLGGPSQRRLASSTATAVLQAIVSMEVVSCVFTCHLLLNGDNYPKCLPMFLWNFTWSVIEFSKNHRESGAEVQLAAYEALVAVLQALSSSFLLCSFDIQSYYKRLPPENEDKPFLDHLLVRFVESINTVIADGVLTRSRRAILMDWKWLCLYYIISIPYNIAVSGVHDQASSAVFSDASLRCTMVDVVESLENASESSALSMFRCVRLILGLLSADGIASLRNSCDQSSQVIEKLVHSSWVLHRNCNKRHVAPISALLSSILHPALFGDSSLHEVGDTNEGPLKWFIGKLLEEGMKSPRTIRLLACHLTGLWFIHPTIIKYYIKELKLLSLYGSVAFDEDFEAELSENLDAQLEVSFLAQSPHSEFAEAFINTEMYARVSIAMLFSKLANMVDRRQDAALSILSCGKAFLLELLTSAVNDKDLSKELYKKYSGIHRRKVRAWQMLCVLSCYVEDDIVQQVTSLLHICLHRNNLAAVRQYLEIFAINIYLKFPLLTKEQLIPVLCDYNMRPQALSSYVFIAANVIIHASDVAIQFNHLHELLPHIIPLLTSHHHSLRGFTQVLVYHALSKLVHVREPCDTGTLEKKCFENLKSYLRNNVDCRRLRASMEGFLDSFNPEISTTPTGIFNPKYKASDFECVTMPLMEHVTKFLDDVREDLRYSMAKDMTSVKNDSLSGGAYAENETDQRKTIDSLSDTHSDFQKKITLDKHEKHLWVADLDRVPLVFKFPDFIWEMEKEDLLLSKIEASRSQAREKIRKGRQQFILVASLLDRIPNLAGLARTCEVFKATGLVVADASIAQDKQFQLISVTAEKWIPITEVPVSSLKIYLGKKRIEGFSILGLEQTANSTPLDQYSFPKMTVLVLGREKEGIPVDIIHILDACVEIPQLGAIRSLNVHVSGAIALWEYTRQQRCKPT